MLKRCFASFFIVCLVFSVSVLPCFAETVESDGIGITASVGDRDSSSSAYNHVNIPFSGKATFYTLDGNVTFTKQPLSVTSAYYAPVDHDRTMYISIGIQNNTAGYDSWFNGIADYANKPTVYYSDSRDDGITMIGLKAYPNGVDTANDIYETFGDAGEIFNFKITIPAYSNSFEFSTANFVTFTTQASPWKVVTYGGFIVDTADNDTLSLIESILSDTNSIDGNITNIATAVNDILVNSNFTTEVLEVLAQKVDVYLPMLDLVNQNVEAIYYLLSDALMDESEAVNQQTQQAITSIQNQANQEAYYQAYMQGSYDRIDLENFDLTFMDSSLGLVTSVFGDMWNAFGQWKVLYTFPLFLGMALLVIGRISRTGGGNSSRNSEHKGGEGGA